MSPSNPFRIEIPTTTLRAGSFAIVVDADAHALRIERRDGTPRTVWQSVPGESILTAAVGRARVRYRRGSFRIRDTTTDRCTATALDSAMETPNGVVLSGPMHPRGLRYQLRVSAIDDRQVRLAVDINGTRAQRFNRLTLQWASDADEGFLGFGAQYSFVDMKGRSLPIWAQEQGIGRGLQPLSRLVDLGSPGSAGTWHTTYTAVPYFLSTRSRGFAYEGYEYCRFDFRRDDRIRFKSFSSRLRARLYAGDTPGEILRLHTELSGRMPPLPAWVDRGAIVRLHGGSDTVRERIARLRAAGVPLAGVWIEDWCGKRKTLFGTRLWWNWEPDASFYPDWSELVAELGRDGIRVVTYFNPYLVDASGKANRRRHLYAEARARNLLVARPNGRPFLFGQGGFRAAIVDLSNPEAREWIKSLMLEQIALGVAGWMNDFAEALPLRCVLHSGEDPAVFHNRYVEEWARLAREAVRESGREGEIVFFSRSGALRSPEHATLFWLGDQTVTWDHFDGIKTVVRGLLSSGLSGYSLNHSDIGGYFSTSLPGAALHRTRELHQRWAELAVFSAAFRTHATNEPERNHQCDSDEETLKHFAAMARLFVALTPYRASLVREAASSGTPLVRHTFLHDPEDPQTRSLDQQFLFGPDLLVAPVLDPGTSEVAVYLPRGRWVHVWNGKLYESPGMWIHANAPIGRPAAFAKPDSEVLAIFRAVAAES